ncbi:MAG: hypothetical protein H6Q72_4354 [Firmicutes bacterium]|nr:hypothetical protein [Bacillota bacterium]
MSLAIFPDIMSFGWNSKKRQVWENTYTQKSANGRRKALCTQSYPTWEIECEYPYLTDDQRHQLAGFFAQLQGPTSTFLWLDPEDNIATDVRIGTGDGTTVKYYLVRNIGGYLEPVKDIVDSSLVVKVAGATRSVTLGDDGLIMFGIVPAQGAAITATFQYYFRVAFDDNNLEWTNFWYQAHKMGSFTVVTVL